MRLKPSDIYFIQDTIENRFDDHGTIGSVLDAIFEGTISVECIPIISVFSRNGKWFTTDNRRLWIFRQLETLEECFEIDVILSTQSIPDEICTTKNGGIWVTVRGNPESIYATNVSWISNREAEEERTSIVNSDDDLYGLDWIEIYCVNDYGIDCNTDFDYNNDDEPDFDHYNRSWVYKDRRSRSRHNKPIPDYYRCNHRRSHHHDKTDYNYDYDEVPNCDDESNNGDDEPDYDDYDESDYDEDDNNDDVADNDDETDDYDVEPKCDAHHDDEPNYDDDDDDNDDDHKETDNGVEPDYKAEPDHNYYHESDYDDEPDYDNDPYYYVESDYDDERNYYYGDKSEYNSDDESDYNYYYNIYNSDLPDYDYN